MGPEGGSGLRKENHLEDRGLKIGMEGERERPVVEVMIPVYKPDEKLSRLLQRLSRQTYPVSRILVVNTEEKYWRPELAQNIDNLEVCHISKEQFDHGGTRNMGAGLLQGDILIFMTDDAVPKGRRLVERLVEALGQKGPKGESVAMAYARQLPADDCQIVERYIRHFNYPKEGCVKTSEDLSRLGIKTYFASNVCCAYQRQIFERLGGFVSPSIFNEDMIFAAGAVKAGYGIAYASEARVVHSHNLTFLQQFRRNFDLAVSQADHPEVFHGLPSEGEGLRMIKAAAEWLLKQGKPEKLLVLIMGSACKYAGYRMGKIYRLLPRPLVLWCSMNEEYWKKRGKVQRAPACREWTGGFKAGKWKAGQYRGGNEAGTEENGKERTGL